MHAVRGIPGQRQPLAHIVARQPQTQREGAGLALEPDRAEPMAEPLFEFILEHEIIFRHEPVGIRAAFGPHDGGTMTVLIALERQDREGSARQEMLVRAPAMGPLMAHRADNAFLVIVEMHGLDARQIPDRRAHAIAADNQGCRDFGMVGQHDDRPAAVPAKPGHRATVTDRDAQPRGHIPQGAIHDHIGDHVRKGLARLRFSAEAQKDRTHRVCHFGVCHHHFGDRLGMWGNLVPGS